MTPTYEAIVAGLGAMGSAAVYHLARRGARVLGLERFTPPHTWGSSHGQSRIIRAAYAEGPLYVPLVQHAYELWHDLQELTGQPLYRRTGGLMIGRPQGELVSGTQRSAQLYQLAHAVLPAREVRERFSVFRLPDEMVAVWEPSAGVLFPEACITAHLELARELGVSLRFEEPVTGWEADGEGVRVRTGQGQYRADRLVLTAGAWLPGLVPDLGLPLTVERQAMHWFEPAAKSQEFQPDRCPIFVWEYAPDHHFYGFPDLGEGIKAGIHHQGQSTDPDKVNREVAPEEVQALRSLLARFMPDANGPLRRSAVCMYTNTPDFHFLIDFHPARRQVLIASPCSGHGFKFSSAIGEVLADLAIDGTTPADIAPFGLDR